MGDSVSRAAVIDEIVVWTVEDRPDVEMPTDLIGRIENLPSAEPEIIRCKDCKHYSDTYPSDYCGMHDSHVEEWNFCSCAERRTDAADKC